MSACARVKAVILSLLERRALLLTLGFAALYLATFDSEMGSPDETQRYALALEIARRGPSALEQSGALSKYPPLLSIVAALPMKLGLSLDGGEDGLWTHRLGLSVSLLSCIALIPLFFSIARSLSVPADRAAVATALFGLTNPLWPYSKRFFSEALTATLAMSALAGALAYVRGESSLARRRLALVLSLACLLLLPLNNMVVPIGVGLAVGAVLVFERRFAALALLAGTTGLAYLLVKASLRLRFGDAQVDGYDTERFTFGAIEGLHGLLFGFGRSVFLYAPLVVLSLLGLPALAQRSRGAAVAMVAGSGAVIGVIANWWCWWGGICWGPRLVLPILPLATIGVAPLLEHSRPWKRAAAAVLGAFGLYVQVLGFSFKHDFDIFFWMREYYVDERRSWFDWESCQIRRMPRHFREHPWDLSSSFLSLEPTGPSVVEVGKRPASRVEIIHRGDALIYHWSITDLFVVLAADGGEKRVPAGEIGAKLWTFNGQDGGAALDGDARTRWSTGSKRLDGMSVVLSFPDVRRDIVRLELEHLPNERDFPNGLSARVQAADGPSIDVPARAATPRLRFSPFLFLLLGSGAALTVASVRGPRNAERPANTRASDRDPIQSPR